MRTHFGISKMVGLVVIFLFISLAIAPAQTYAAPSAQEEGSPLANQTWVRLGGPLGGIGYDIKMDPTNPDVMYVTDAFSGIHKSIDGGKIWFPINNGIDVKAGESGDSTPVFCVTIDPNDTNTIWVGLQNSGAIYKSINGGETWTKKVNGIIETNGFTVRGISVEPGNSNIIYAAGEISSWFWAGKDINFEGFDMTKGVVYKSTNGGESWDAIWRGENLARYIIIDPKNPNTLYISTGIFDRIATNSDPWNGISGGIGIFKSIDGGVSWKPINNGLGNLNVGSMFIHPTNTNILLAGTGRALSNNDGGGIYRSEDGGMSWHFVGGAPRVVSVEISTTNPQIAYAADVAHSNFFRSDDGGITWKTLIRENGEGWGPDGIFAGWPIDLQIDPRDPMRIFVNNYGGGNFLSEDGGITWNVSSTGYSGAQIYDLSVDSDNAAIVFSTGKSGTFRSDDGGVTWMGLGENLFEGHLISPDPDNLNILFYGRAGGMLFQKSTDGGKNWKLVLNYEAQLQDLQKLGTGESNQGVLVMSFAPADPNIIYAGISQSWCYRFGELCDLETIFSIAKSNDRGDIWQPIYETPFNGRSITGIVVHPMDANSVWVATAGSGVYKTLDGGVNWKKISSETEMDMARSLQISLISPDTLLVGTDKGVFASRDGGISWEKSSSGMDPNDRIWDIVFDPLRSNIVYAGSLRSGIYISNDFARTWKLINSGLTNRSVYTLAISSDGETLYAGTNGEGVFRLSTHDQVYFNSLAPTPTAIPPTITPTSAATKTPVATSTPVLSTAAPKSSISPIYIGGTIVLLIGLIAFVLQRRKARR